MKALRADPLSVGDIFRNHEFIIPEFQRPYSWGVEECEQLWTDVSSFLDDLLGGKRNDKNRKEQYFLGSIVVYPGENEKVWVVIDGQQRLTTLLILTRMLFEYVKDHTILEKMCYKTDPDTDEVNREPLEPRLVSRVLAGGGRNDREDLRTTINFEADELQKNNQYRLNFDTLREKLDEWMKNRSPEEFKKTLTWFRENIVMLPIVCDSLDDALTLFRIINDRGMSLTDADIFKAKIYEKLGEPSREDFIKRWNKLDEHETLFRIHMHVLRAGEGDIEKEIGLRRYMQKYFGGLHNSETNWVSIVKRLEGYHSVRTWGAIQSSEPAHWEEKIYWAILGEYPNSYWGYPLHVFLNKYGCWENGGLFLKENKHDEYIELLKNTVQYFYIKGVVYNSANRIKDTTFKVCAAIEKEENYLDKYRENIKGDLDEFRQKLSKIGNGSRYLKGIVWLCSFLNRKQVLKDYAETIKSCHMEHILPRNWAGQDGWSEESHKENLEKIGNKVPLEWKRNIQAKDTFFQRKQKIYKESKIRDAVDLSEQESRWYPEDVKKRQDDSMARLNEFFDPIFP